MLCAVRTTVNPNESPALKKSLLVLAAGMGSRYGGLKQMDPIGPGGEFILDYGVGDAVAAGFSRVVFVVRPDIEADFREIVGGRWEKRVEVVYARQSLDALPPGFSVPPGRVKPWGTGHAVLCARDALDGPFAVVNADDWYGPESLKLAAEFLDSADPASGEFCSVAYRLANTLSANGTVSRGICSVSPCGMLSGLVERTALRRGPDGAVRDEATGEAYPDDTPVSMNLFGFTPAFPEFLAEEFPRFLSLSAVDPKAEFQMPTALSCMVAQGRASVKVLRSPSRWIGVTSRADREAAAEFFRGVPSPLA